VLALHPINLIREALMGYDLFDYPLSPGHYGSDTSRAAAEHIASDAARLRTLVLGSLRHHGPATADEVAGRLALSILSVRPRCTELLKSGAIVDTGNRRPNSSGRNAKVWRVR
jgi:hypothetical protein